MLAGGHGPQRNLHNRVMHVHPLVLAKTQQSFVLLVKLEILSARSRQEIRRCIFLTNLGDTQAQQTYRN